MTYRGKCDNCGAKFETAHASVKYCTRWCRDRAAAKRRVIARADKLRQWGRI